MTLAITHVDALEVLDSRGTPTVQARVTLSDGVIGVASVPSGASTGAYEALELRDGDARRYRGKGVLRAVRHVRTEIAEALHGDDPRDQAALDRRLIELDGTPGKSRLGANALLAVSLASALAVSLHEREPFFRRVAQLASTHHRRVEPSLPLPMVNLLSGGKHAGGQVDFQDFLVVPRGARSFAEALEMVHAVWHAALGLLVERHAYQPLVADEGGLAPKLASNEAMLALTLEAIERAGYRPLEDVAIAIDVASTHFHEQGRYRLAVEKTSLGADEMIARLADWRGRYPILSIEDGLAEEDWEHWPKLQDRLGSRCQILGDDLFVTNPQRIARGVRENSANSVLIKVNQIGTLTEALHALAMAREAGWTAVVSARSGETEDAWLADLATGGGAGQIKVGSITRSERLAKYNRLLAIEHDEDLPFARDALDRFAWG
jgi:enolase